MALPLLSPFVAALVALGLAALLTLLTLAVVNFLKSAPFIGGWIANKAALVEQTVVHALGEAFAGIDSFIGASLHALARLLDFFWGTITGTAHALRELAHDHLRLSSAVHALLHKAHAVARAAHGIDRVLRDVVKKYHGIEHRVKTLEHDVTKGIGHDLRLHVKALERELDHVDHEVVPSLRHAEAQADAAIDNLYEWARGKASLLGVGTFAFAVAAALADLGLGFLKCSAWRGVGRRLTCGMGAFLLDLLEGAIAVMVVEDICAITHLAIETIESEPVTDFLTHVTDSMDDLLTCQGVDLAPALGGPYYAPPPLQPAAQLAA